MPTADSFVDSRAVRRVTPAQMVAFGLIAAAVGWGIWLVRERPVNEEVELLPGTVLPSSEMAIVEAAFDRAQLVDHRTEDGRVWVPRIRQSAYMRALVDAEALPREFGSSLRRALESNSPWQSRAVQEEILRVAVQEELAHVICSMPGIERAAVLYDVEERGGLDGSLAAAPRRTASVNIRTQPDAELEPARVQAIRVLVAASIAGLEAERVAVTDLRSGRVYAGPLDIVPEETSLAATDPVLARRVAHERHLAGKVRQALSFVKGAVVDVTVSFTPPAAQVPPEPTVARQAVAGANTPADVTAPPAPTPPSVPPPASQEPETVAVSVAIPETYMAAVVRHAAERTPGVDPAAAIRGEEDRLREHVLAILPPALDPATRRITISSFPVVSSRPSRPVAHAAPRPVAAQAKPTAPPAASAAASAGPPTTPGQFIDVTWKAVSSGNYGDVPKEMWLLFSAKFAAIATWLVMRYGGAAPRRTAAAPGEPAADKPRIDWSTMEGRRAARTIAADEEDDPQSSGGRRVAA